MLHYTFFKALNIKYLNASEPFTLGELYNFLTTLRPDEMQGPAVLNLSQVNVANLKMPEIRQHLIKKAGLLPEATKIPCVYIVSGEEDYLTVSESIGFAGQTWGGVNNGTFVTDDLTKAATWLARLVGKNRFEIYRELNRVIQPMDKFHPYK